MPGAKFRIDLDGLGEVQRRFNALARAGQDLTTATSEIGERLLKSTKARFRTQTDPTGKPWAPLSPVTLARKAKNRDKILTEYAYLSGNLVYQAGPNFLEVGSPSKYAGTHQFGAPQGAFGKNRRNAPIPWGNIPARPFLGLSDDDRTAIHQTILNFITNQQR